ncbi:multidrug effflux MFS transporter [Donghicola sp. C2-DW-16]|uniref:Bcr/CflA family efflux transporter n=1 Tax=Donghicola mangrovi TaxID=2729614 RepID=A0A850Q9D9_9RHOB|nr:multidrug effflux MFS transporter [Donghicola mangrovi]NVO23400.1 multidrug effflux MFS transporter [Donghicola mangrovi]NVO27142.1 multidrug effflux MFS transporter [Donghicola mangrovi]
MLNKNTPPHIATLIMLAGLAALSMNIFLPSLPGMTAYFQTDYRLMQLSVALYLGVNAVLQLFIGPIADRYGRRPVLLWGISLFLVATLGCLFAPTAGIFLIFRMSQAVIVTGMVLSRAIVRDIHDQDSAASMIGYVTMGMALVPMISPAVGGLLDAAFGWKANFWSLLILGCLMLWLTWSDLGETGRPRDISLFQQFAEYPLILRSRRFWAYALAAAAASGAFFAYLGGAPFIGSEIYRLPPETLGFYFSAPAIGYFAGNFISGKFSRRWGINRMILWGSVINSVGIGISLLLHMAGMGSVGVFFGFMTAVGLGNGMVIPNATSGSLSVIPHLAGTASGLGGAIMIGGGAALSALAGSMLSLETGATPLLLIMLLSALAAIGAVLYIYRRERHLVR